METFTIIISGIIGTLVFFALPIITIVILVKVMLKLVKYKINFIQQKQNTQEQILEELKKQNQKS